MKRRKGNMVPSKQHALQNPGEDGVFGNSKLQLWGAIAHDSLIRIQVNKSPQVLVWRNAAKLAISHSMFLEPSVLLCDSLLQAYRIFQDGLWQLSCLRAVSGRIGLLSISLSQWSVGMLIRTEPAPGPQQPPRPPSTGAFCKASIGLCERLCWMSTWPQDIVIFWPITKESWELGRVVFRNPTWFLVCSACYSESSQTD